MVMTCGKHMALFTYANVISLPVRVRDLPEIASPAGNLTGNSLKLDAGQILYRFLV